MTQLSTLDQLNDVQRTGLSLLRAMDNAGLKRDTSDGVWGVSFRNYFNIADRYYVYDVDTSRLPVLVTRLTDVSIVSTLQAAIGLPIRAYRDQIIDPRTGRTLPLSYMVRLERQHKIDTPTIVPFNLADRPHDGAFLFPIGLDGLTPIWESLNNSNLGHILIAGATGSGKSSAMRSILSALLLTESAADLNVVLVDPKKVEFAFWRGIPHLVGDIATDLESATAAAQSVMNIVEDRLELFARNGVLDLNGYNKITDQKLPRIIFAVDELLDLAMQGAKQRTQFYTLLIRNAGKARAAGVTLLLATTDPRADTIDASLRDNCKLRIAFYMADRGSSTAIIDSLAATTLPANRPGRCVARIPRQRALMTLQAYYIDEANLSTFASQVRGAYTVEDGEGREPGIKITAFERSMIAMLNLDEESGGLAGNFSIGRMSTALKAHDLDGDRNEIARIAKEWERRGWLPPHVGGKGIRHVSLPENVAS